MLTPHRNARFKVRNITKYLDEWAWLDAQCIPHAKIEDYRRLFFSKLERYLQ